MTPFQLVALPLIGFMIAVTTWNLVRLRWRAGVAALWLVLWLAAAVAVAVPQTTTAVAHLLGIQRGADFVFYCSVLGSAVGFFLVYVRLRLLNRQITLLVRELALRTAAEASGPAPYPPESAASASTGGGVASSRSSR
jgi:hypothetical protein